MKKRIIKVSKDVTFKITKINGMNRKKRKVVASLKLKFSVAIKDRSELFKF